MLINGREKTENKKLKNPKALDYLRTIDDVYENLENYNSTAKRKVLIVFEDMESNEKLNPIVTELRWIKFNISLVFISQSCCKVPKTIRLTAKHDFLMKMQQIASNNLSDIDFNNFVKLCKDYTKEPCSFLVRDTNFSSDNSLRFRKNLM